jgi:hypothetical protein
MPPESLPRADSQVYRIIGLSLLFLIIATIVFVFVKTLVFDQPINNQALKQALLAASVGVTLSCLIAWVLDLLQVIELRAGWGRLLWSVLIVSILTSSAVAYKQFATQTVTASVACVWPISVDQSTHKIIDPLTVKSQEVHKRGEAFAFLLAVRDLQADSNGDNHFDVRWEFDDVNNKAAFTQTSHTYNRERARTDSAALKRLENYKRVAPNCVDRGFVDVMVLTNLSPTDSRNGSFELNIVIYDNVGKSFARVPLPITLFE